MSNFFGEDKKGTVAMTPRDVYSFLDDKYGPFYIGNP